MVKTLPRSRCIVILGRGTEPPARCYPPQRILRPESELHRALGRDIKGAEMSAANGAEIFTGDGIDNVFQDRPHQVHEVSSESRLETAFW